MSDETRFVVDGTPLQFQDGDTVLDAMLRAGMHPTGGGCLCAAGDCPHCLVTVDGVGYVRACQTPARAGAVVRRDHLEGGYPPLPLDAAPETPDAHGVPVRYEHCDVVVIGRGESGRDAIATAENEGRSVVSFDLRDGEEVIGIYPGPLVVARTPGGMVHVEPRHHIVVATGASEIHPVAPGNELAGILTARAAERLAAAGVDLGEVVAVGHAPEGVEATALAGEIVRFEGEGSVSAVVVDDGTGEARHECNTVSVGLGLYPRDVLARMASGIGDIEVSVVGDAALPAEPPSCPAAGTVCVCSGIGIEDLDSVWDRGFQHMELLKRATLAGTGTCQGSVCTPYLRSFVADRGAAPQPAFTARPLSKQRTIGEIAAGAYHHATPCTPLHREHLQAGAQMERAGGWWRPWTYGNRESEYGAVREGVSIGDVSTLGKMIVAGPDAEELLERLYPTQVSTIRPGRARYVLLLDERGYVLDDGMICREADDPGRFYVTFTSGGSTLGELWMRDWADSWELDVRLMNQTMSLAAINVTGPHAARLLHRCGARGLPGFGAHVEVAVAGVPCRVLRLSFTGELSYELHHAAADAVALWRRLLEAGQDLGCVPHGLETLLRLRLEKGHIVVGQDSDYDSTARRLHHDWAVRLDKPEFVGKLSVERTDRVPLDKQLVGLEMDSPAPIEGAVIWRDGEYAGYITSSADSPVLGKAVMLGWVRTTDDDGTLPDSLTVDGRPARRTALPFYDPQGARARVAVDEPESDDHRDWSDANQPGFTPGDGVCERVAFTRVVATPEALDALEAPAGEVALRVAADEVLATWAPVPGDLPDPAAIVEPESGFAAGWWPAADATRLLASTCEWALPEARPAFAQGSIADLPVKLWLEADRALLVVPAPYARDLEDRLAQAAFALTEAGP